jgi:glycosyltransferase involved in cell wall biosynthesis
LYTYLQHVDRGRIDAHAVFLEPGTFERDVAALGFRTTALPMGRIRDVREAASLVEDLRRLLRRERPDAVLNWVAKAQLFGGPAAALARVPAVWWQHGVPHGHWMDRLATALPAAAVGCSSTAAAEAQRLLRPRRPVFVVHPGIAREVAPRGPDGTFTVGIVGRLQPWKGQHLVIEAVADLRRAGFDVRALVVGGDAHGLSPEYAAELEALIDHHRLREHVTLTGHVADTAAHIAQMDVLVNASEREPFGIVLLEGMAQGLPVVAVGDAGPRDIVEHETTGFLLERRDTEHLVAALSRLAEDPKLRERMGRAARKRFEQRFSADRMAARITERLEQAAG